MAASKRTCSIDGCDKPHSARGWCLSHYGKWRRTGNPEHAAPSVEERFFSKVHKTPTCWAWTAAEIEAGYGKFWDGSEVVYAHVYSAKLHGMTVPAGWEVDHLCKNTGCVNPAHLEPVTGYVNNMRSDSATAINAAKTHCKKGHEFTDQNTYLRPDGKGRNCLTCRREADRSRKRAGWRLAL